MTMRIAGTISKSNQSQSVFPFTPSRVRTQRTKSNGRLSHTPSHSRQRITLMVVGRETGMSGETTLAHGRRSRSGCA